MRSWLEDLRYATRALAKRPLYTAATVLVLMIAIGANATVFSVFNGLFLRPLPYPDGDRLVDVHDAYPRVGLDNAGTSIPSYLDRREEARSLESLAIYTGGARTLGGEGPPQRVFVTRASPSLFEVLRVGPSLGRAFTDAEATPGNDRVLVLSDALWRTRFGGRPDVLGREVRLDGESFRVIGVMPPGFGFPSRAVDAWMPFAYTPEQASDAQRDMQFSASVGRLRPGATVEALNAELEAIVRRNVENGVVSRGAVEVAGFTGRAQPLRAAAVGDLERTLLVLQATVLAVLLIACANVANFQLTRVAARRKELAMRAALGADARRLVRLVLIESAALALAGGAGGLVVALGGLELVRALGLDRSGQGFEFALDGRVLGFTMSTALAAALLSGLPGVLALLREDPARVMHEAGRLQGGGRKGQSLRNLLVTGQVGLSVALLVGAGLLMKSFYLLQQAGPGFEADGLWTGRLTLPQTRYADPESRVTFQERALAELAALPGVVSASFTSILPFTPGSEQGSLRIGGRVFAGGEPEPHAQHRRISEGYLPALGIPLVRGRNFAAYETERVAIVDENMARKFWPDGTALGQRIRLATDPEDQWYTVVGVVPAVKDASLAQVPLKETVYWHYRQRPAYEGAFVLRTALPPEQLTRAAAAAIARLDPELALSDAQPMEARVRSSLGPQRTPMVLLLVFAAVALTLAVIGIYGVLSWAVTQRTGEIGVRMALGARAADIVRMVVRQGATMLAAGLVLGVATAVALGRVLAAQIGDLSPTDPAVYAAAVVGLSAAALFASWLPARRAASIAPTQALRAE